MFSTHVALVPLPQGLVAHEELLHVASALQTQVTRDFGPVWGVSGMVSPFLRLEDVPPVCLPLVIVRELPKPGHGFHIVSSGRPVAIIEYRNGWSLLASHELLEMLCDPWGYRSVAGRSPVPSQGEVEYLVEICDPCQYEHYTVDEVHVSDFVTPTYYGRHHVPGHRCSFTGALRRPLEVPAGGLLTWRTSNGEVWQRSGTGRPRKCSNAQFSRAWRNSHAADRRTDITDKLPRRRRLADGYYRLGTGAKRYGSDLEKAIGQILAQLGMPPPGASLEAIVTLLKKLVDDPTTRRNFECDPEKTLRDFNLDPPPNVKHLTLQEPAYYRGILAAIDGGLGVGDPRLAEWLSTHGSLVPAGIW